MLGSDIITPRRRSQEYVVDAMSAALAHVKDGIWEISGDATKRVDHAMTSDREPPERYESQHEFQSATSAAVARIALTDGEQYEHDCEVDEIEFEALFNRYIRCDDSMESN